MGEEPKQTHARNENIFQRFRRKAQKPKTEKVLARTGIFDLQKSEFDSAQLLHRAPRNIDVDAARRLITGKRVMITGAGGTIGSELVRQVIDMAPAHLVMIDNAEFNLYQIDMEMHESGHGEKVRTCLVDVCRPEHLEPLFEELKPEVVIHAAAYKHVPIAEKNPSPSALTNVLGAKNVFDTAIKFKAEAVVFISTDKAVNPTSFMGATKRIAELYAQALDIAQTDTRFVTVRFGNVLGSTGSVVPLFQRQIAAGGPITVTHPDICRFFMTTKEAVQLVLQAASLNHRERGVVRHDGRIFVLDMGEPVKITELAERMIKAAGLIPGEDIEIKFSGLRSGEKLFEEIFLDTERLVKTGADGVLLASPMMIDLPLLNPRLEDVIKCAKRFDNLALADAVHHLVPEFKSDLFSEKNNQAQKLTSKM